MAEIHLHRLGLPSLEWSTNSLEWPRHVLLKIRVEQSKTRANAHRPRKQAFQCGPLLPRLLNDTIRASAAHVGRQKGENPLSPRDFSYGMIQRDVRILWISGPNRCCRPLLNRFLCLGSVDGDSADAEIIPLLFPGRFRTAVSYSPNFES
jgi:hypothetical protein